MDALDITGRPIVQTTPSAFDQALSLLAGAGDVPGSAKRIAALKAATAAHDAAKDAAETAAREAKSAADARSRELATREEKVSSRERAADAREAAIKVATASLDERERVLAAGRTALGTAKLRQDQELAAERLAAEDRRVAGETENATRRAALDKREGIIFTRERTIEARETASAALKADYEARLAKLRQAVA